MVQWLGLQVFTARASGSVPLQGTEIPQVVQPENLKCYINNKIKLPICYSSLVNERLSCAQYLLSHV